MTKKIAIGFMFAGFTFFVVAASLLVWVAITDLADKLEVLVQSEDKSWAAIAELTDAVEVLVESEEQSGAAMRKLAGTVEVLVESEDQNSDEMVDAMLYLAQRQEDSRDAMGEVVYATENLAHREGQTKDVIQQLIDTAVLLSETIYMHSDPAMVNRSGGTQTSTTQLRVDSFSCILDEGAAYVRGEVTNISTETLNLVVAIGTWRTADGTMIQADQAAIDFDPLMPGQTSTFQTISYSNSAMVNCSLKFKEFAGPEIRTSLAEG